MYTAAQYESIFTQLANGINGFLSTKVEGGTDPDEGEGGGNGGAVVEGETVYVYLADGSVDAFSLASLDGNYYVENGRL